MKKGETTNGFKFSVEDNVLDDMELVDAMAEAEDGEPKAVSLVVEKILGKEQRKKLYDHVREKDGRVPTEPVMKAIGEIIDSFNEGKK